MAAAARAVLLAILLVVGGCQASPTVDPEDAPHSRLAPAACDGVPPVALRGRITDAADILTPEVEASLSQRLARYQERTQHQMVVATTTDLNGVDVGNFATCLGNRWGIGRKGHDDGIVILLAPKEKQMRIATGDGLRKQLTDERALSIVNRMTPRFRQGDYSGGLELGIDSIAAQTGDRP
ncbi:hypothetical protein BWQ93_10415 [Sphingopyxis sp. QXT-31]|uniref:TPM domain-containing protein n=1 Tax=Sphingopyxis sp. QXT-31 TaxID=1357916 RepID=UPI0009796FD8|nr:TPM domain-containing protein [Sphingopyxis sp. QXT-31]APZ98863.1 hypothetical protein BWQ93_10415 [Sphingopyxis sp. QXT-31]